MTPHDCQGRSPSQQDANERAAVWIFLAGVALVAATVAWVVWGGK